MNPLEKALWAKKKLRAMFPTLKIFVSLCPTGLRLEVEPGPDGVIPKDLPKEIDGVPVRL